MAKSSQSRKKISPEQIAIELSSVLRSGDRVTLKGGETEYLVTRASSDNTDVDLNLPGTNIERFRVPVADLNLVETSQPASRITTPVRKTINVEDIREHLATVQRGSIDQLSGDIAVLKKYLKSKGAPAAAIEELDRLCHAQEDTWNTAIAAISKLLEE